MFWLVPAAGLLVAVATALLFSLGLEEARPDQRLQDLVRRGAQPLASRELPGPPEDPDNRAPEKSLPKKGALTKALSDAMQQILKGRSYASRLEARLRRAGVKLQAGEFVASQITVALAVTAVGALLLRAEPGLLLLPALLGFWLPEMWLRWQRRHRMRNLEGQLADALAILANSLRSGYSLLQAMDVVSREMPDPIAGEFAQVLRETRVNIPLEEALTGLQQRVESDDLGLVITAVLIQRQVGGNLAEVLETISNTIRDRVKLLGEIRTLTTQGRLSGWIVSLLPIGLGFALYTLNPEYMAPLFKTPFGWMLITIAIGMQGIGIFVIQRMVQMEV